MSNGFCNYVFKSVTKERFMFSFSIFCCWEDKGVVAGKGMMNTKTKSFSELMQTLWLSLKGVTYTVLYLSNNDSVLDSNYSLTPYIAVGFLCSSFRQWCLKIKVSRFNSSSLTTCREDTINLQLSAFLLLLRNINNCKENWKKHKNKLQV